MKLFLKKSILKALENEIIKYTSMGIIAVITAVLTLIPIFKNVVDWRVKNIVPSSFEVVKREMVSDRILLNLQKLCNPHCNLFSVSVKELKDSEVDNITSYNGIVYKVYKFSNIDREKLNRSEFSFNGFIPLIEDLKSKTTNCDNYSISLLKEKGISSEDLESLFKDFRVDRFTACLAYRNIDNVSTFVDFIVILGMEKGITLPCGYCLTEVAETRDKLQKNWSF